MSGNLKNYFDNLYKNDRISHAFLICNSNYDSLKDDLKCILSDYFFEGANINLEDNCDIYLIKPENGKILKESVLSLQKTFKTKSLINKNRIYIIDGIETMNDFSSNSLLKFLEEPENNIYAFLISSNINKVLPTIRSRCQILMVDNSFKFDLSNVDEQVVLDAIKFIQCYENYGTDSIAYIYKFIPKKPEREIIKIMINVIKYFYRDCLSYLLKMDISYFNNYIDEISEICEKNNIKLIINKLIALNKCENMLEYNLNLNLFLDKLIIEMEV